MQCLSSDAHTHALTTLCSYMVKLSCRYEVFLDLSLPLTKEGKGGVLSFLSKNSTPSIEDCLSAFTTDEVMQVFSQGPTFRVDCCLYTILVTFAPGHVC